MFKRYSFTTIALIIFSLSSFAKKPKAGHIYKFAIDLNTITDDKVKVELQTPVIRKKSITYHIPKIVPGTYSEDDYGRYVEQFKAFNKKGDTLQVVKNDVNSWTISNSDKLYKLSYLVNDSYDDGTTQQVIFEPAGSNIQKDTNYVINNHCFFGYFDDMKNLGYEITVLHPSDIYGSTALTDIDKSDSRDKFVTETYNMIVDNPFMYNVPDTSLIKVGNTDVLISVYSPTKKITSKFLAEKLDTLLQAQGKYLGGKLPVDKYAFLIYFDSKPGYSGGEGALEHSYCSMYYYPERAPEVMSEEFVNHAAHEFFHIITPLTIHSEEIQFFDFNTPKMSQHLWLYEGSTEYHANIVQEKYGIITAEELLNRLSGKITNSRNNYNDTVAFTKMSANILGAYKDQFGNVYQKGALITMCLDIKLLQLSQGKYGIMNLIRDLSNMYGKEKGFKDSVLFTEIEKLTYPEIREFLDTYVAGSAPLPLEEIFTIVGVNFTRIVETKDSAFSMGRISLGFNPQTGRLKVNDTTEMNALGRTLGYQTGDEIISLNGKDLSPQQANSIISDLYTSAKVGDSLVIKVMRNNSPVELRAEMTKFPVIKYNMLTFNDGSSPDQLMLRDAWLKPRS